MGPSRQRGAHTWAGARRDRPEMGRGRGEARARAREGCRGRGSKPAQPRGERVFLFPFSFSISLPLHGLCTSNRIAYEARVKRGEGKELGFITYGARNRGATEGQF